MCVIAFVYIKKRIERNIDVQIDEAIGNLDRLRGMNQLINQLEAFEQQNSAQLAEIQKHKLEHEKLIDQLKESHRQAEKLKQQNSQLQKKLLKTEADQYRVAELEKIIEQFNQGKASANMQEKENSKGGIKRASNIKVCLHCGHNRRKNSFHPEPKNPDGLSDYCKFCIPKL